MKSQETKTPTRTAPVSESGHNGAAAPAFVSRYLTTDDGLVATLLLATVCVVLTAMALNFTLSDRTWIYDFFFERQFVQWVLLWAFFAGGIHLLERVGTLRRERRALARIQAGVDTGATKATVARRWRQIQAESRKTAPGNFGQYAKHLAEHDEAELDAAYRLSGDIVQILPLIGFFGTVFGLSRGLYGSFLTDGGATPKVFAKAIAVAFDNTLLGLALTILLFAFQSIVRKREEAVLLNLNLLVSDVVSANQPNGNSLQVAIDENVERLVNSLDTAKNLLDSRGNELKELVRICTLEVGAAVLSKIPEQQRTDAEKLIQTIAVQVKEQTAKMFEAVSTKASVFATIGEPLRDELKGINSQLTVLSKAIEARAESHKLDSQGAAQTIAQRIEAQTAALTVLIAGVSSAVAAQKESLSAGIDSTATKLSGLDRLISDISRTLAQYATAVTQDTKWQSLASSIKALEAATAQNETVISGRLDILPQAKTLLDAINAETNRIEASIAAMTAKVELLPETQRKLQELASAITQLAANIHQRDDLMLEGVKNTVASHSRELQFKTETLIKQPRTFTLIEALREGRENDSSTRP